MFTVILLDRGEKILVDKCNVYVIRDLGLRKDITSQTNETNKFNSFFFLLLVNLDAKLQRHTYLPRR